MTKYNEGDVLEILEDFTQLGAGFKRGDKYEVTAATSAGYNLKPLQAGLSWSAYPKEFDRLEIVRKVEPFLQHMELGKTYQSTDNELFYTPTEFDFEAGRVSFDYASEQDSVVYKSTRPFCFIEDEFGVLPPVKPENTLAEAEQEDAGGWDREEFATAAPKPETVSVDALREAYEYVDHEYLDLEKLIQLAKRLS